MDCASKLSVEYPQQLLNSFKHLEVALEVARDTESKARIQGVSAQMNTFQFPFGTMLGEMVLRYTDNLSRSLQEKVCSAAEG